MREVSILLFPQMRTHDIGSFLVVFPYNVSISFKIILYFNNQPLTFPLELTANRKYLYMTSKLSIISI